MDMQIPKNHLPHEQFEETKTAKQLHPFSVQTAIQSVREKPEIQISSSQIPEVKNGKKEPPIQKHMQHILSDIHMASFVTDVSSGMPSACANIPVFAESFIEQAKTIVDPEFWKKIAGSDELGKRLMGHVKKNDVHAVETILEDRKDFIVTTMNENKALVQKFLEQRNDS